MIAPVYSTMSALRAYRTQMGVVADNIANVNTSGFRKSRAVLQGEASGGVRASIERGDTGGGRDIQPSADVFGEGQASNVQLEEELPRMMVTQRAYEANLKALQTADEMLGSVLDIMG